MITRKKHILVVDDNPDVLKTIVNILDKNESYNLYQALSIAFAIKVSKSRHIDLIISDWEMPGGNGIELINALNKNPKTADIPIIIVTGVQTSPKDLEFAFETGAVDFIRKPFDNIELLARVKSIFREQEYQAKIIEQKNKELALHAMYLLETKENKLEYFSDLKEIVILLNQGKEKVLDYIHTVSNKMDSKLKRDSWADFETYFNQIHPNFTQRLSLEYPQLTPAEIRLSVFLRMNMSSQSISDVLNITVDSIKTARTRLRSKLKIDRSINLVTFISSI